MISDSKLKVMLCEADLRHFDIKAEQLDYSNTETKRMFWDILNRAKHQTGFDTDGQRVLVQLYPSKEGGCEMFVTKIGLLCADGEHDTLSEARNEKQQNKNDVTRKPLKNKYSCRSAFSFDTLNSLFSVCQRLIQIGYIGESSAYVDEKGKKYLFLSDIDTCNAGTPDEFAFILEYGKIENAQALGYYISEHGTPLCNKEAVSTLSRL